MRNVYDPEARGAVDGGDERVFTGLIEHVGRVVAIHLSAGGGARLSVDIGPLAKGAELGDSIAINGCCLTISKREGAQASFDAVPETLKQTTLVALQPGARVNLERALTPHKRLGGHFVQGHIDGSAVVRRIVRGERWAEWHFMLDDPGLSPQIVRKGSIAIDGISLTVAGCDAEGGFWVAVIPETLRRTVLTDRVEGSRVNIETDILGKYVQAMLSGKRPLPDADAAGPQTGITESWLHERGFGEE